MHVVCFSALNTGLGLHSSPPVFVTLTCTFRYGQEGLEGLDLSFRKNLFNNTVQVLPPQQENTKNLSDLQQKLIKKLGPQAYPFTFSVSRPQSDSH